MLKGKLALIAGVLAIGISAGAAQALPVANLAAVDTGLQSETVRHRVVCDRWGRCWRPPHRHYYQPYGYAPGPSVHFSFGGGPRWHGHRHHHHRHWHHRGHRHW